MRTFDVNEAVKITRATQRQIDHLITSGCVTPVELAPRRGMSRKLSASSLRYIAVAARLLSWGLELDDVRTMLGTDRQQAVGDVIHPSVVDGLWREAQDPKDPREVLLVWRIVDPASYRTVAYLHHFVEPDALVSAARDTGIDAFFINLKRLADQVEAGTAIRNMVRAGIPERVSMALSGHKTRVRVRAVQHRE